MVEWLEVRIFQKIHGCIFVVLKKIARTLPWGVGNNHPAYISWKDMVARITWIFSFSSKAKRLRNTSLSFGSPTLAVLRMDIRVIVNFQLINYTTLYKPINPSTVSRVELLTSDIISYL